MQNVQTSLPIGTVIRERYLVQSLLHESSFGAVYVVRDLRGKRNIFNLFALKEVINLSKQERYQISLEGVLLRRVHHLALPRVYTVISDDKHNRLYMLMDYIEGPNAEILQLRQPEKRFSLTQVISIMAPIMDAVTYLHSQQPPIIHQDIKPANIVLPRASNRTRLVDFGIAKQYNLDATNVAARRSLTGYEAPEQYSGEINTRTDIYGLGATFYTLLTGTVPTDALYRKTQLESKNIDPLEPVNQVVPTISTLVAESIHRAMSLSSNDRFPTVEQFWQALNANPTGQQLPERIIAPSVPSHPPIVSKQARAAIVSVPKQPHTARSRKLGVLLLTLFIVISFGTGLWSYAVGYHGPSSATPTSALLRKATPPSKPGSTVAPTAVSSTLTPTSTPYPNVARAYNGTIYNIAGNITTNMSLTGLQQEQGNISGNFVGLQERGSFRGTISTLGHIQFIVTGNVGQTPLSFEGSIRSDGTLTGSYCSLDQHQQCAGEYGIWSVDPAS